jgi:hemerythrin-like metal-binding protein
MEIEVPGLLPEALLVDLPEIDQQHEEIFSRISSLKAECLESGFGATEGFEALLELFAQHFATEQLLADEAEVDFTQHAKIHRDTLRILDKALGEVFAGTQDVYSFLRFSEYWFERHINEDDRSFVRALQAANGRRSTPRRRSVSPYFSANA